MKFTCNSPCLPQDLLFRISSDQLIMKYEGIAWTKLKSVLGHKPGSTWIHAAFIIVKFKLETNSGCLLMIITREHYVTYYPSRAFCSTIQRHSCLGLQGCQTISWHCEKFNSPRISGTCFCLAATYLHVKSLFLCARWNYFATRQ